MLMMGQSNVIYRLLGWESALQTSQAEFWNYSHFYVITSIIGPTTELRISFWILDFAAVRSTSNL